MTKVTHFTYVLDNGKTSMFGFSAGVTKSIR
jgi:hypothetical protein